MLVKLKAIRKNDITVPMLVSTRYIARIWPDIETGRTVVEMSSGAMFTTDLTFYELEEKLKG